MAEGDGLDLEFPGIKVTVRGWPAATTLLIVAGLSAFLVYFLFRDDPNALLEVITRTSIGKRTTTSQDSQADDVLRIWIPDDPETSPLFAENEPAFESWLDENVDWWGRSRLANIRRLGREPVRLDGWLYELQYPLDGSVLLEPDAASTAIQHALDVFELDDRRLVWAEIVKIETR